MATDERDELRQTILAVLRRHAAPKIVDGSTVLSLDNVGPYKLADELAGVLRARAGELEAEYKRRTGQYDAEVAVNKSLYSTLVKTVVEFGLMTEDQAHSTGDGLLLSVIRAELRKLKEARDG